MSLHLVFHDSCYGRLQTGGSDKIGTVTKCRVVARETIWWCSQGRRFDDVWGWIKNAHFTYIHHLCTKIIYHLVELDVVDEGEEPLLVCSLVPCTALVTSTFEGPCYCWCCSMNMSMFLVMLCTSARWTLWIRWMWYRIMWPVRKENRKIVNMIMIY